MFMFWWQMPAGSIIVGFTILPNMFTVPIDVAVLIGSLTVDTAIAGGVLVETVSALTIFTENGSEPIVVPANGSLGGASLPEWGTAQTTFAIMAGFVVLLVVMICVGRHCKDNTRPKHRSTTKWPPSVTEADLVTYQKHESGYVGGFKQSQVVVLLVGRLGGLVYPTKYPTCCVCPETRCTGFAGGARKNVPS